MRCVRRRRRPRVGRVPTEHQLAVVRILPPLPRERAGLGQLRSDPARHRRLLACLPAAGCALFHRSLVGGFSIPRIARVLVATRYLVPSSPGAVAAAAPPDDGDRRRSAERLLDTGGFLACCFASPPPPPRRRPPAARPRPRPPPRPSDRAGGDGRRRSACASYTPR